jgi:UDP-glucose 4-epimerase
MKILVTGGAGFIASHIVDLYIKEGYEVIVVDDLSTGKAEYINKRAKFYKLDIKSGVNELNAKYYKLEDIFKEERPDIVNHHAAQISVVDSIKNPVFDANVNILGTINLLENCVKYNVKKFIFASSGGTVYEETDKLPIDENYPLKPVSPYGVSKMVIETYLYFYKKVHHLDSIIFRYSNVYGPRQDPYGEAGVVAIFANKMLKGENPIINGDGNQTRDFVYISDAAKVNLLTLKISLENENKIKSDELEIFNIGTGIETSVNELFYKLKDITKANVKEIHGPPKLGELRRSCLSFNKAKKILGWEPEVDIDQGLKLTVNYFKKKFPS